MEFIFIVFIFLIYYIIIMCYKYRNPYKLIMLFGAKGSGKTTLMTKWAVKYMNKNKIVYSTFYIPGARIFDTANIGKYTFEKGSFVFCDEVGMIWDNRKYKDFNDWVRNWFKLQRKYKCTVILASQGWDIDVKLRILTDCLYICECKFNFISIARKIKRKFKLVDPTGESESRIADKLELEPIWLSLLGAKSCVITHIPTWTKYFQSFDPPELPPMPYTYQYVPAHLQNAYKYIGLQKNEKYKRNHELYNLIRDMYNRFISKFIKKKTE